jgi:hypothetical protein
MIIVWINRTNAWDVLIFMGVTVLSMAAHKMTVIGLEMVKEILVVVGLHGAGALYLRTHGG